MASFPFFFKKEELLQFGQYFSGEKKTPNTQGMNNEFVLKKSNRSGIACHT